jgi:hypothetical protein
MTDEFVFPSKYAEDKIYSSFAQKQELDQFPWVFPEDLETFYNNLITEVLRSLGLHGRSKTHVIKWCQIYNNSTSGHPVHSHFCGKELFSWVHFVNVPEQKCFFFVDSDSQKIYPETQSNGDLIVFPSWVMHGVDPINETDKNNRIVVSGNVVGEKYLDNPFAPHIVACDSIDNKVTWTLSQRK